jgi:hypothetical protein
VRNVGEKKSRSTNKIYKKGKKVNGEKRAGKTGRKVQQADR